MKKENKKIRCECYTKPGIFKFAQPVWTQCENNAIVKITVEQKEIKTFPACKKCWNEVIDRKMKILNVIPI